MTGMTPRWEWRTFRPDDVEKAARTFASLLSPPEHTDEIYIVCDGSDLNVKLRRARLDVKALQRVSPDGLEQWSPVATAVFPLSSEVVQDLGARWHIPELAASHEGVGLDAFLDEVVAPRPELSVVRVEKRRATGAFGGCRVEIADLLFNGEPLRTGAVEHEDPRLVVVALNALGLNPGSNVSYVRALRAFLSASADGPPRRQGGATS